MSRRLLSLSRYTGPQSPRDVQSGRTQRQSRGPLLGGPWVEHDTPAAHRDFAAPRGPWRPLDVLLLAAIVGGWSVLLGWALCLLAGQP